MNHKKTKARFGRCLRLPAWKWNKSILDEADKQVSEYQVNK